jgi:alkylation response protein AidB-like acyl-CoA dehydrogenase
MTQTDTVSSEQEDLRLLRESARTLFERAGGSGRARKLRDADGGFDPKMVRELAEAGVFGVAVPEDQGGLGMGLAAGGVIAEEAGRVIAPEPVVLTIGLSSSAAKFHWRLPGRNVARAERPPMRPADTQTDG